MPEDEFIDQPIADWAQYHLELGQTHLENGPPVSGVDEAQVHYTKAQAQFLASIAVSLYTLTAVQAQAEEREANPLMSVEMTPNPMERIAELLKPDIPPEPRITREEHLRDLAGMWRGTLQPMHYLQSISGSSSRGSSEGYVSRDYQPVFIEWLRDKVLEADTAEWPRDPEPVEDVEGFDGDPIVPKV